MIFSLLAKSRARSKGILWWCHTSAKALSSSGDKARGVNILRSGGEKLSYQTPLRCIGPILTTCRIFSLLRIPSRRPRVMPATLSSLVPLIMWLSVQRA